MTKDDEPYDAYRETKHASAKNDRAAKVRRDLVEMMRATGERALQAHVSLSGYSNKQILRILSLRLHDETDAEMADVDYYIKDEIGFRFAMRRRNKDGRKRRKRPLTLEEVAAKGKAFLEKTD
jgi:hypothetical protein